MICTYKHRLRPNQAQEQRLEALFWHARKRCNAALEQGGAIYKETAQGLHYPAQWAHFRAERSNNSARFGMLNASSVQQMLRRLDKSFSAFFRRLQAGETPVSRAAKDPPVSSVSSTGPGMDAK